MQVADQNRVQVNLAESDRQEHVRRNEPEGQNAGDRAAVETDLFKHRQKRRNQHRNECDMHRDQILRGDGNQRENQKKRIFEDEQLLRRDLPADPFEKLPRDEFRDA